MAIRASKDLKNALIKTYVVAATKTVTIGKTIKFTDPTASPPTVEDAGSASDVAFAIATKNTTLPNSSGISTASAPGTSVAAGGGIEAVVFGHVIVPMVVGTGGATAGKKLKVVSDGVTDVGTAGFTTDVESVGIAHETGVVTDTIGVIVGSYNSRGV